MTPQRAKELLPFIMAFANDEVVQHKGSFGWYDSDDLDFIDDPENYRIKPVPRDDKWAMQQMKAGKKVRRRTWNSSIYIENHCAFWSNRVSYVWNYPDSIATDWEIAE
jgi:hypothetical protein